MPVTVLLVDDDATFRERIRAVLAERGYDVVGEAGTLAEARAAVAELSPEAMLLDVNLPDGNGIRFAGELSAAADAPRIVLTSNDPGAVPARLVARSGATGFFAKTDLSVADLTPYLG
jgi:DNA-binding NarL/FixJ family response regulator